MALYLIQPVRAMLDGHDKVLAARTRRWFAALGIGTECIAPTGAILFPIDAKTPITNPECQAGFDEQASIALQILLHRTPAKPRSLRHKFRSGTSAELWCAQHVLPGGDRLFEHLGFDLVLQGIVGADISRVRDYAISMPQMLCESE
jgi:hypothetical protein